MTSSSNSIPVTSTALVPYDPTLPHISLKAHLEAAADKAVSHAFEVAKFESQQSIAFCSQFSLNQFEKLHFPLPHNRVHGNAIYSTRSAIPADNFPRLLENIYTT
jgi:hypothetical protein